jgi:hypothetical protein
MPNRTSTKRPPDLNQHAYQIVQEAIVGEEPKYDPGEEEREKNPAAVALGRLGGLKGGKARAERMTSEELREAARKAALARWAKKGQP